MEFGFGGRVQFLQAQLFPTCALSPVNAGGKYCVANVVFMEFDIGR